MLCYIPDKMLKSRVSSSREQVSQFLWFNVAKITHKIRDVYYITVSKELVLKEMRII